MTAQTWPDNREAALRLGEQGWEMVGITMADSGWTQFCFKRPAP